MIVKSLSLASNFTIVIGIVMVVVYLCMFLMSFLLSVLPLPPPPLEVLTLSILSVNFKLHLCLFYPPPSSTCAIFDNLCTYLQSIDAGHLSNFVFLGDFNINHKKL